MIEVRLAGGLSPGVERDISEVFVDAFGHYLSFFAKDPAVLAAALAHMFVLDVFYVALIDGEVVGIAACTDGSGPSVQPVAAELRSRLGFLKGTIAHRVFVHEFQKPPIETGVRTASVEFVATRSAFRRRGVAAVLLKHILGLPQFDNYVLEVANTNDGALRLYEKAGFEEFRRIQEPRRRARSSGIDALVYMRYSKH